MLFLRGAAQFFGQASEDELFAKERLSPEARARIKQAVQSDGK
jgi:hypothetical protein